MNLADLIADTLDDVTGQLAAARERAAVAAWELTRPDMRHRLLELVGPGPRFDLEHAGDVLTVTADPPCYACTLGRLRQTELPPEYVMTFEYDWLEQPG